MSFSKYLNSWDSDLKTKVFDILQKYGNLDEMVSYIDNMPSIYIGGKNNLEISIDKNFFIICKKKEFKLVLTNKIKHCCYSEDVSGCWIPQWKRHTIYIIGTDGNLMYRFCTHKQELAMSAFCLLGSFTTAFDNIIPTFNEFRIEDLDGREIIINSEELIMYTNARKETSPEEFAYKKTVLEIRPISNIIWCEQYYCSGSDCADEYGLRLYMIDGKKQSIRYISNVFDETKLFNVALHIKNNVPHLLYGPSAEYKKIFNQSPAKLLELAKQKCSN